MIFDRTDSTSARPDQLPDRPLVAVACLPDVDSADYPDVTFSFSSFRSSRPLLSSDCRCSRSPVSSIVSPTSLSCPLRERIQLGSLCGFFLRASAASRCCSSRLCYRRLSTCSTRAPARCSLAPFRNLQNFIIVRLDRLYGL